MQRTDFTKTQYALLTIVGGFLESYAIINRGGLFANAQTANFTHLWLSIAEGDILNIIYYLLPFILYCLAIIFATVMQNLLKRFSWPKVCLLLESACVIVLGCMPSNIDFKYAVLPIFFCTALQYQTFITCRNYAISTIFVTNNIRQCASAITLYFTTKDKEKLEKFKTYLFVIAFFALGVVLSLVLGWFGDKSILFCLIPLLTVFILI